MQEAIVISFGQLQHECYTLTFRDPADGLASWDVTIAKQLVAAGHIEACVEIPRDIMQGIADRNEEWIPAKLDAADPSVPGISVPMVLDGHIMYQLIDGNHRIAKALREGRTFQTYLLTAEASRACLIHGPAHRMPWGQA
jgi:hypothetical protein